MVEALVVVALVIALAVLVVSILTWRSIHGQQQAAQESVGLVRASADATARLREDLTRLERAQGDALSGLRRELGDLVTTQLAAQRQELASQRTEVSGALTAGLASLRKGFTDEFTAFTAASNAQLGNLAKTTVDAATSQRADAAALSKALGESLTLLRTELASQIDGMTRQMRSSLVDVGDRVTTTLVSQGKVAAEATDKLSGTVEQKLTGMQLAADAKLEQMRQTVDEKLSSTLSTRLGESFKQVSDRMDQINTGFGEMKSLANNVTDLRRVMTNVKTRGVWGEVQLANLLEQIFAPSQYERNFKPRARSGDNVEFALRLPGPDDSGESVYLPIDSKFPVEDYQRLVAASEIGDVEAVKQSQKALEAHIYDCAKSIRDKYINPPVTTDFAVLFLPTEALYAEVIKMSGAIEDITRTFKVIVQGPSTFAAFSMALLMGFSTLSIQKRSAEIGKLLGAIKTDFTKFGDILEAVDKRLDDAKGKINEARGRSTQITRKLGKVEALPESEAKRLLPDTASDPDALLLPDLQD